jgi:putative transposase
VDHHLEQENEAGNTRNGYGRKRVLTDTGNINQKIFRNRLATFDPLLITKYQRRFPDFDQKIMSTYASQMN